MQNCVSFTEQLLMLEEQFNGQNHPLKTPISSTPNKNQAAGNQMDALKNAEKAPLLNSSNFNNLIGSPYSSDDITDFDDFLDLNQPLPNVSIREQLRLVSVNRGRNLGWMRNNHKRLEEIWLSQESNEIFGE
ncbi:uncharacterized protein LOC119548071 [Drosophila subpulchrella]|uniref:uncharacterized protein LOC119548071 n=1 Tax=Drosophila subpulchrella TaxID=1486046 RepID=UPI0018A149DD|nr:uncharacterized protein LOC119548071 [Drosophila subpulchrella]